MGIIDLIFKQPAEKIARGHNWINNLPAGTSIATVVVTAIDLATKADATALIIDGSTNAGSVTTFVLKNGTDLKDYKITLKMTRSDGLIFEDDYTLKVREV
jgi:hypothetical protein